MGSGRVMGACVSTCSWEKVNGGIQDTVSSCLLLRGAGTCWDQNGTFVFFGS